MAENRENSLPPKSLNEQINILATELELAISWNRPLILLSIYKTEDIRINAESALEHFLVARGQRVINIDLGASTGSNPFLLFERLDFSKESIFFIYGMKNGTVDLQDIYKTLDYCGYILREKVLRAVFWLTQNESAQLAHCAPEFWSCRHRVVDFEYSLSPEQFLHTALESAWQDAGTCKSESMPKTILSDLPDTNETKSIRATRLLTLGILNWRNGNYEKAHDFVKEALNLSINLQDSQFESECFNAMALVNSSIGKVDFAIEAYKQAIKLAPGQIFVWNNLGNLCLKIDRNDEAMVAFQRAIEHNTKDPIAWNGLGDIYAKIGYLDDAITAYKKAIESAPDLPQPWVGIGDVYVRLGQIADAFSAFEKAISIKGDFVKAWTRLGELHDHQGQTREAIKAYRKALILDPVNATTWNNIGSALLKSGSEKDSIKAFTKAIELDSNFGQAYCNLALICSNQRQYKDALSFYLKCIEVTGNEEIKANTWQKIGDIYRWLGETKNAMTAYEMADNIINASVSPVGTHIATEKLPTSSQLQEKENGSISTNADKLQGAQEYIEELDMPIPVSAERIPIQERETPVWVFNNAEADSNSLNSLGGTMNLMPSGYKKTEIDTEVKPYPQEYCDSFAWNEKGNEFFLAGKPDDACRAYLRAIEYDNSFGWAYNNLAFTYLSLGMYEDSVINFQMSIETLNSEDERATSWNGLGHALRHLGDYANAVAAFQAADDINRQLGDTFGNTEDLFIDGNSMDAQVWNELGSIFLRSKKYDEAINVYKKAIEIDPYYEWSYVNLALANFHKGEYLAAIQQLEKSLSLIKDDSAKATCWNRLGDWYRKINDYDKAVTAYLNASKLEKDQMTLATRARFSLLCNCYGD